MTTFFTDDDVDVGESAPAPLNPNYAFVLADVPQPGAWRANGRCRTVPTSVFFPMRGEDVKQAKEVCDRCAVLADCRAYALEAGPSLVGVWGGMTTRQRDRVRRGHGAVDDVEPGPRPEAAEQPAPTKRGKGELYRWLEALTAHPGRWAKYGFNGHKSAAAVASMLNSGDKPKPPGRWTIEARRDPEGHGSHVYARYDGPEDVDAA